MSKRQWIMILGLIATAIPFLGLPNSWDTVILPIIGVLVIIVAYKLSPQEYIDDRRDSMTFSEHRNNSEIKTDKPISDTNAESHINSQPDITRN